MFQPQVTRANCSRDQSPKRRASVLNSEQLTQKLLFHLNEIVATTQLLSRHPITNNNITKHLRRDCYALLKHCFKSLHLCCVCMSFLPIGVGGGGIYILRLWRGFTLTLFMFIISSPSTDPLPLLLRAQLSSTIWILIKSLNLMRLLSP